MIHRTFVVVVTFTIGAHCMKSMYQHTLEGAMKLKIASLCSSRGALSDGILFFAGVKIFQFWPKTMDYSQAF